MSKRLPMLFTSCCWTPIPCSSLQALLCGDAWPFHVWLSNKLFTSWMSSKINRAAQYLSNPFSTSHLWFDTNSNADSSFPAYDCNPVCSCDQSLSLWWSCPTISVSSGRFIRIISGLLCTSRRAILERQSCKQKNYHRLQNFNEHTQCFSVDWHKSMAYFTLWFMTIFHFMIPHLNFEHSWPQLYKFNG